MLQIRDIRYAVHDLKRNFYFLQSKYVSSRQVESAALGDYRAQPGEGGWGGDVNNQRGRGLGETPRQWIAVTAAKNIHGTSIKLHKHNHTTGARK